MKKTLLIGLLLVSASAFAFAGPHGDMRMMYDTLNLTSKQKQQLKTIRKEARDERIKLMDQMDDLRDKTNDRVMAVLNDDQKKQLLAIRSERMQQRKMPPQRCDRGRMPERGKMMPMQ
jgi:Skp family chaperone for outer membrane proteins